MSKKSDGVVWTILIIVALVIWLWDSFGWWVFLAPPAMVALAIWATIREDRLRQAKPPGVAEDTQPQPTIILDIQIENRPVSFAEPRQRTDHDGEYLFAELQSFAQSGNYDAVRDYLRKFAWATHRYSTPMFKARLADFVSEFAKIDPLFNQMWPHYEQFIRNNPGTIQSKIYPLFPNVSTDDQRYVLYFAEHLNLLRREKKGSSYALFIPSPLIDSEQAVVLDDLNAVERQMLTEFSEKRYIYLPLGDYWQRHLNDPDKTFKKLVNLGYFRRADDAETLDYYFKKSDISDILKAAGLPVSGRKDTLIERLLDQLPKVAEELLSDKELFKPINKA